MRLSLVGRALSLLPNLAVFCCLELSTLRELLEPHDRLCILLVSQFVHLLLSSGFNSRLSTLPGRMQTSELD